MATLRELRSRIKSVNSTKKITKAQELIATSRITRAQARVAASKPYATEITKVLSELASASASLDHPMLNERPDAKRAAVLVVTSDSGMCGGYNANVLKEAEELSQLLRSEGKEPVLFVMGNKGLAYYNFRDRDVEASWSGFSQQPRYTDSATAGALLVELFLAGSGSRVDTGEGEIEGVDELHIVYTQFVSMLTQTPQVRRMAPLEVQVEEEVVDLSGGIVADQVSEIPFKPEYDFEPDAEVLLAALLPKYINTRIYAALLDAAASESAARRTAMKAATDNATDLVNILSREANQARQAQITQEISEIVGGADALSASAGRD